MGVLVFIIAAGAVLIVSRASANGATGPAPPTLPITPPPMAPSTPAPPAAPKPSPLATSLAAVPVIGGIVALVSAFKGSGPGENWTDWLYHLGPRVGALTKVHFDAYGNRKALALVLEGYPNPEGFTPDALAGIYFSPDDEPRYQDRLSDGVHRIMNAHRAAVGATGKIV